MTTTSSLFKRARDVWSYTEQAETKEPASRFLLVLHRLAPLALATVLFHGAYTDSAYAAPSILLLVWLSYLVYVGFRRGDYLGGNAKQLWFFALAAQIPWLLYYDTTGLNILFTLALGLLFVRLGWAYAGIFMYIGYVLPIDYGWLALLLPSLFHLLNNSLRKGVALFVFVVGLQTWISGDVWTLLFLFGMGLYMMDKKSKPKGKQGKWTLLYPVVYICGLILLLYFKFS